MTIRVTPRTLEQIAEGFCAAEDIEAAVRSFDRAEQAVIDASFCPRRILCLEVRVDPVKTETL